MECDDNEIKDKGLRVRKEFRSSSLSDAKEARPIVLAVTADTYCDHEYALQIDQGAPLYNHIIAS
jgi:hypothetical protein